MRLRWVRRILAVSTAVALLGASGAQAILLGCGPEMLKSCCCGKADTSAPQPTRFEGGERACCTVTPAAARHEDATPQATLTHPAPLLVAVAATPLPGTSLQPLVAPLALDHPRSAGPPILRTTCSLLI